MAEIVHQPFNIGEVVFRTVFGADYAVAGQLAGWTLWCLLPLMMGNAYPAVLIARGAFRPQVIVSIAGVGLITVLMFLLVPSFGPHGAIASAFAGLALPPLLIFVRVCREGLASPVDDFWRPVFAVAASLACYLFLLPVSGGVALVLALIVLALAAFGLGIIRIDQLQRLQAMR